MQRYDTVAISGMGGIGKTELAVKYARTHLEQKTYPGGVVWLKAREDVASQIVLFARSLPMPQPPDDFELAEKVKFYWRNWQDAKTLVILDDVQDYGAIKSLLPVDPRFKILLTTRLTLQRPIEDFEITVLSEETAIELLRAIVSDDRLDQDLAISKQISNWLGYLPLGIELVGRYLARRRDTSLADLWQRLQDKKLDAKALKDATPEMTASLGVAAAFELSWQELDASAQQLAALLSLFALAEIPWMLVEACLPEDDPEALEDRRDESLLNLHLLERTGQGMYQLHQLLREFFAAKREQMVNADEMKRAVCGVIVIVAKQMPMKPTRSHIEQFPAVIPHVKEASTTLQFWLTDTDLIQPFTAIARFYEGQGAYNDALSWSQYCREKVEARLGSNHPHVASSLNNLAGLYETQGHYAEAEPLYVAALDILERQLGADHPFRASSLNNLAGLYKAQGRYAEAEPLYIQALTTLERQLGADHLHMAASFGNLGNLYHAQERYTEAEPLFIHALEIVESQLGADHPHMATSLNNLATLYHAQERYTEAESLYVRALAILEYQLGADHPDVASYLNNLAGIYHAQGRYAEAEPLYVRALDIRRCRLRANHPAIAQSLNNLAYLYQARGLYAEAEPLHNCALNIWESSLGADHPDVAQSLNNLAKLYAVQGRYEEAEPYYLRTLDIFFNRLGGDHPNTQTVWQNFCGFMAAVMQAGQTGQLSDHPVTQDLLRQMRERSGE